MGGSEDRVHRLLQPLTLPPVYRHVVERVRRSISLGEYLPGERLPSERVLAEALGVSRPTVREALKELQDEGLLESRRGAAGGPIVLNPADDPEGRRQRLLGMEATMRRVHEFRLALEPMAAGLAAQRRSGAELAALVDANESLASASDAASFRQADSAFHLAIANASGNILLGGAIEDARSSLFTSYDSQGFEVLRESSYRGHLKVIEAIERRDDTAAAAAMRTHLDQAWSEILEEIAVAQAAGPAS